MDGLLTKNFYYFIVEGNGIEYTPLVYNSSPIFSHTRQQKYGPPIITALFKVLVQYLGRICLLDLHGPYSSVSDYFSLRAFRAHVIRVHDNGEEAIVEYKQELMARIQLQELYGDGSSTSVTLMSRDEMDGGDIHEVKAAVW